MSKKRLIVVIGIVIIFVAILVLFSTHDNEKKRKFSELDSVKEKVNYQLSNLTLEEKIGQMLMVSYDSTYLDDALKSSLTTNKPGGFILFKDNFSNYNDSKKLIEDIKSTSDIPMFISIDQEGGLVQRLKNLSDQRVSVIPSMDEVGKLNDKDLTNNLGKVIAEELRVFGINMNFAPVVDTVNSESYIASRSFGSDPNLVADLGIELAKGMSDSLVIPVYKHFPGHGSVVEDSHKTLPVVNKTKEELLSSDLVPFIKAIENNAEVIMIGHLSVPEITGGDTPASLSKEVITDLLKNELGYKGLVITDALNMGALTNNYEEKEILEKAINAGVDILLMHSTSSTAIKLIKESIEEGKIKTSQIDESVRKILTLKYEKLENIKTLNRSYLNSEEHQEVISKFE